MLSEKSTVTVRGTLPLVDAAINKISARFYERLFTAHPQLLRDLFNRGNQAAGTQSQALAGSIAAFAAHLIEHPDTRPDAMLGRIAHKHVSLGIQAGQYAIVHEHLFAAIAEVLAEAVTPDVAAAWDEVYWLMANALMAIERRLDEEAVEHGWRQWKVVQRVPETADVVTFLLRPVDEGPVPAFRAGQYVSVQVELPDGARQIRQYSLSGVPGGALRQISVKKVGGTPEGEVSHHLHSQVREGDVLDVSAPCGDLVLDVDDAERPLLLASAGIGVTPMVAMLSQLAQDRHSGPVIVVHGDRAPADHALRADHETYARRLAGGTMHVWYEKDSSGAEHTGYVNLEAVDVPQCTRAYLCGPLPFMRAVRSQLIEKGVAPSEIHYEVFGPDLWLAR
ncbi:globin domain-containing protein [Streptomyces sp. NPDC096132]|uniref:globin domain-containing protein n=1 Tax=Streptomyces sp. NPDC096132 TaxID=3366075 RepID=UPI0037F5CB02